MNIGGSYTWKPSPHGRGPKTRIPWPSKPSEFEVQSFLHSELQALGYVVRGEVGAKGSRFDLVIYDHLPPQAKPVEIIEVKKHAKKTEKGRLEKQVKKYREFEVAITIIHGMRQAEGFVRERRKSKQ